MDKSEQRTVVVFVRARELVKRLLTSRSTARRRPALSLSSLQSSALPRKPFGGARFYFLSSAQDQLVVLYTKPFFSFFLYDPVAAAQCLVSTRCFSKHLSIRLSCFLPGRGGTE